MGLVLWIRNDLSRVQILPFPESFHLAILCTDQNSSKHTTFSRFYLAWPPVNDFYAPRTSFWDNLINAYRALILIHLLVCEVSHLLERIHRNKHRPWSYSTVNMIGIFKNKWNTTIPYPISKGLWRRSLQILFSLYVLYCGASEILNLCVVNWRNRPVRST